MKHKKSHADVIGHSKGKMHAAREGHGKGFVEGHDAAIGHGDFANLPQEKMIKAYPKPSHLRGGTLDDTMTGIDHIQHQGESKAMRHLSNQK